MIVKPKMKGAYVCGCSVFVKHANCSRSEEQMGKFPFFQANDIQNYILQNGHKEGCHGIKAIECLLINI